MISKALSGELSCMQTGLMKMEVSPSSIAPISENTLMCLSIGTPKNNKFSICPKWKIHYFQVSQNLSRVQPHYNLFEYWDT